MPLHFCRIRCPYVCFWDNITPDTEFYSLGGAKTVSSIIQSNDTMKAEFAKEGQDPCALLCAAGFKATDVLGEDLLEAHKNHFCALAGEHDHASEVSEGEA